MAWIVWIVCWCTGKLTHIGINTHTHTHATHTVPKNSLRKDLLAYLSYTTCGLCPALKTSTYQHSHINEHTHAHTVHVCQPSMCVCVCVVLTFVIQDPTILADGWSKKSLGGSVYWGEGGGLEWGGIHDGLMVAITCQKKIQTLIPKHRLAHGHVEKSWHDIPRTYCTISPT